MDHPALPIDWNEVTEEATSLLRDYIRINTTNPPGGEEAGAVFLRDVLAREGIDSTLHDAGDDRVSISARIQGSGGGSDKPIVLLSHIDVVPVEQEHWEVDAFSGAVIDGTIWGRGALDMKGMGIMELMTLLLAKRHGLQPRRDIVLLAVADEEEGGRKGMHHIRDQHPELLDAFCVLNEGAFGASQFKGHQVTMFGLAASEKSPCWIKLRTTGSPGHGSVPHRDNALAKLVEALARVERWETPARATPSVEAMLRTLRDNGLLPEGLDPTDADALDAMGARDPHIKALTHDTISITGLHSGAKHNVIPATAEATLDCRLLPDTDPDAFVEELRKVLAIDVEITRVLGHVSGASPMEAPVTGVISEVLTERYGDEVIVVPQLSPGFTDSHAFRSAGSPAYGFIPVLMRPGELAGIHGHNERITVDNLKLGTDILFDVTRRLAGDQPLVGRRRDG
jgi:acetylornithine deacetylase/succinyl-diaminopimelate desuccinylase-like protein